MTFSERLEQILHASRGRTCTETHNPNQSPALAYARSLWALEDNLRQLAASLEGARQ